MKHSLRTKQRHAKAARDRQKFHEEVKSLRDPHIVMMWNFTTAKPTSPIHSPPPDAAPLPAEMVDYLSDYETKSDDDCSDTEDDIPVPGGSAHAPLRASLLPVAPPLKRHRHEIPIREQRRRRQKERAMELKIALDDMKKLIRSKKTVFAGIPNGLQAYRAQSMKSFLLMVVQNRQKKVEALQQAAESHGFAALNGGRELRGWTRRWEKARELPTSCIGCHVQRSSPSDPIPP
jgi:hypothetical protein